VNRVRRITLGAILVVFCLGIFHADIRPVWAQSLTYTVQQGDTLWDVCEKVYGNPDLWPKLWEMNPFITNPHLLKPGDVITLLEGVPVLDNAPVTAVKTPAPPKPSASVVKPPEAYDFSLLKNMDALGYLSLIPVVPKGVIVSGESEKIMLGAGDTVYVQVTGSTATAGDRFTVCNVSPLLKDPKTKQDLGYVVSYLGRLRILERVNSGLFKAVIEKSFRTIRKGDPLLAYTPVSQCIKLSKGIPGLTTYIAAVEDQKVMVGQYTTVYFLKGSAQGIEPGQLFRIVQEREVELPGEKKKTGEMTRLPDAERGFCLVVSTTADTGTAIVLSAKQDIPNGASLKVMEWTTVPPFFSDIPSCPKE